MQKLGLYTYYDIKAQRYDTPFFMLLDIHAERKFIMDVRNKNTMIGNFKQHFDLIKIGEFDVTTGALVPLSKTVIEGIQINLEEEE